MIKFYINHIKKANMNSDEINAFVETIPEKWRDRVIAELEKEGLI